MTFLAWTTRAQAVTVFFFFKSEIWKRLDIWNVPWVRGISIPHRAKNIKSIIRVCQHFLHVLPFDSILFKLEQRGTSLSTVNRWLKLKACCTRHSWWFPLQSQTYLVSHFHFCFPLVLLNNKYKNKQTNYITLLLKMELLVGKPRQQAISRNLHLSADEKNLNLAYERLF